VHDLLERLKSKPFGGVGQFKINAVLRYDPGLVGLLVLMLLVLLLRMAWVVRQRNCRCSNTQESCKMI
jgi:hypothetical protein